MTRDKNLNFLILLTAILFYSSCPRFCRGQGNTCDTVGCGPFGICDAQDSRTCTCFPKFYPRVPQEWDTGNWTNGCARRVDLNCESNNGTKRADGFMGIKRLTTSTNSERWDGQESQCRNRCLENCSCIAYGYDGFIGCMFWFGTLNNVQRFPSGSGSAYNSNFYIRLPFSELDSENDPKKIIIVVVVIVFVVLAICTYFSWKWMAKRRAERRAAELAKGRPTAIASGSFQFSSHEEALISQVNLEELPLFKFEVLANATDNFSEINKLGRGGFGPVYKGELATGKEIAVKRLSKASGQGMQEFMNEVMLISKLQHRNLVRLCGCCVENKETLLIYEYMPNKSLDFFLFGPSQEALVWGKRFNIIEGICRGLLYLHRDSRLKIIHRDLKPSNILLDNDWNPNISDFGMARIVGTKQDHVSTVRVAGTYGYMAPEYALEGRFSEKSDVFSLGVLILEIATGRRNTSFHHQEGSLNLLGHVWRLWNEENVRSLVDPRISNERHQGEVLRCMHIGLLSVQELPKDRQSVSTVLSMLSSETIELPEPKQPAFSVNSSHSDTGTSSSHQQSTSSCSTNDVTLTIVNFWSLILVCTSLYVTVHDL